MKCGSLISIVVAASTLLSAQITRAASETAFDGTWSVTMSAQNYDNPDSNMSVAYAFHFPMNVKNGVLHGESGNRGMENFYEINGTIAADGTAAIRANGISGPSKFNRGHIPPGTPYTYTATAKFNGRHGTGKSAGPRVRIFTFVKN